MWRRLFGILVIAAGLFPLIVGLYKSFPKGRWGELPPIHNPVWLWIDKLMPPVVSPANAQDWGNNCVYVVLLVVVAFGLFLTIGKRGKSKRREWEK
jgi:hypothetical protein